MKSICSFLMLLAAPLWGNEPADHAQYVVFMGDNGLIVLKLDIELGGVSPRGAFERYVDKLMQSIDANSDGIVTLEEARGKFLTPRQAQEAQLIPQGESINPNLSPDSSPADGKISRSEFLSYFKRIGLQPFLINYLSNDDPQNATRQPRQAMNTTSFPLFPQLDLNRDGKLSAEELTGALRTLRKLDLDDDETISAAELNPISNSIALQQGQPNAGRTASTSPFLGPGSEESIPKQVRRLIEKYDSTDPLKSGLAGAKVRNQKLSALELGLPTPVFARYDGDSDGQLDFDELRQFLADPEPTIVVAVNMNHQSGLIATSPDNQIQEMLRTTPDGSANINLGTTQLSVVRSLASEVASAEQFLKPQFTFADGDANGYLDQEEASRAYLYGVSFENLDADKNGKLFLDELTAYFQIRFDAARSRIVLTIVEQGRTLFEILDTDRDRRLSFRELQAAADKLSLWDKDGDGLLAESEVPLQYRLNLAQGNLPVLGGTFVLDGGVNAGGLPAERTAGPIWFRKMDKNRDGEISEREFLGESGVFKQLDQNHDGFVDLEEAVSGKIDP